MIRRDMKEMQISEDEWYEEVGSRAGWRAMCRLGMKELHVAETRLRKRRFVGDNGHSKVAKVLPAIIFELIEQRSQY